MSGEYQNVDEICIEYFNSFLAKKAEKLEKKEKKEKNANFKL